MVFEFEVQGGDFATAGNASSQIKKILKQLNVDHRDIELAMQQGYSTASSEVREMGFGAGMGLPNMKKNTDEMHVTSVVDKGTTVELIVFINQPTT